VAAPIKHLLSACDADTGGYAEGWYTPLVFAVTQGQKTAVQFLLDHGASSAIRSPEGGTLHEIALEKATRALQIVLRADVT
jgi:hypothetical protein